MRAFVVLALAPLVAFAAVGAGRLVDEPGPSRWQTNLVWADRVFVSPAQFERWLAARGRSYPKWAEVHPGAVARLEGRKYVPAERQVLVVRDDRGPSLEAILALLAVVAVVGAPFALIRLVSYAGARGRPDRAPSLG